MYFFMLASLTWLVVDGIYMHQTFRDLYERFHRKQWGTKYTALLAALAYGIPGVATAILAASLHDQVNDDSVVNICNPHGTRIQAAALLPLAVIAFVAWTVLLRVMFYNRTVLRAQSPVVGAGQRNKMALFVGKRRRASQNLHWSFAVVALVTASFTCALASLLETTSTNTWTALQIVFALCQATAGALVLVYKVLFDPQVRRQLRKCVGIAPDPGDIDEDDEAPPGVRGSAGQPAWSAEDFAIEGLWPTTADGERANPHDGTDERWAHGVSELRTLSDPVQLIHECGRSSRVPARAVLNFG